MDNSNFKILIGDTTREVVANLQSILQDHEYRVLAFTDIGEILRSIDSREYDLIILDIKIYAQLILHHFNLVNRDERDAPIILLTTDEDFTMTMEAIEQGAVDFLDKPVKVKRLLVTVRNAIVYGNKLKELRKDREELSDFKELYERIINSIDHGLMVVDSELRIESVNEHIWRKHRKDSRNPTDLHCYDYFYGQETICDDCRVKEVFETGLPVKYNIVNRAVGGINYFLEVEAFPLTDKNGNVHRAVQIIKDVTERIKLEKELLYQKEYLENLVSHAPIGIFTTDVDGFIRTANPAFAKLIGEKQPNDAIGINVLESEKFKQSNLDRDFNRVLIEGIQIEIDSIECKNLWGKDMICALSGVPLYGADEEIIGLIGTLSDVTEKWRLQESYLKRITELSIFKEIGELLQSTNDLDDIYAIALIGVTAGRGLGFNRAFLLRYDRTEHSLVGERAIGPSDAVEAGRIWSELYRKDLTIEQIFQNYKIHSDDQDITVTELVKSWRIPVTWEDGFIHDILFKYEPQNVLDAKDGSYADRKLIAEKIGCNSFAAAPLISRGKIEGIVIADNFISGKPIIDEDVNRLSIINNQVGTAIENSQLLKSLAEKVEALRQMNSDLKENRDLLLRAERLSVIGEVAASVAHEIRNPLTSIGGFTRAVLRDLENTEKTRTNRRFLNIIIEEVKRLERIVNEILAFVRPVLPRYASFDLNEVIEQTFNMMEGEIDPNIIVITKDYQKNLPSVWLDADQIRQVLLNIFRNAIHAMLHGGMLSVITSENMYKARIHISDTGHGIPADHKEKLFTAFFTTKSTGSGLGLTVSAQIIKNHGGTIEVESIEGEGSTFIITLPLRSEEDMNEN